MLAQAGNRRLFAAQTISRWGDTLNAVALVVLVYRLTRSGLGVSGTVIAEILPVLLLAPVAGAVADRHGCTLPSAGGAAGVDAAEVPVGEQATGSVTNQALRRTFVIAAAAVILILASAAAVIAVRWHQRQAFASLRPSGISARRRACDGRTRTPP